MLRPHSYNNHMVGRYAAPFVLTGAKLFKVEYTLAEPQSLDYAQIALVEMALVEIALVEMAQQ